MTRLVRSFGLAGVFAGASLACACASNPADPYAQATRPRMECPTGSRICREVDPRTGRARTPFPVISIQPNGEDLSTVLKRLPFVY